MSRSRMRNLIAFASSARSVEVARLLGYPVNTISRFACTARNSAQVGSRLSR